MAGDQPEANMRKISSFKLAAAIVGGAAALKLAALAAALAILGVVSADAASLAIGSL